MNLEDLTATPVISISLCFDIYLQCNARNLLVINCSRHQTFVLVGLYTNTARKSIYLTPEQVSLRTVLPNDGVIVYFLPKGCIAKLSIYHYKNFHISPLVMCFLFLVTNKGVQWEKLEPRGWMCKEYTLPTH